MIDLALKIYTLQGLANVIGTTHNNLRQRIYQLQKANKPLELGEYKFIKVGEAKAWIAVEKTADVELIDLGKET